jgi:hypothetical protein
LATNQKTIGIDPLPAAPFDMTVPNPPTPIAISHPVAVTVHTEWTYVYAGDAWPAGKVIVEEVSKERI